MPLSKAEIFRRKMSRNGYKVTASNNSIILKPKRKFAPLAFFKSVPGELSFNYLKRPDYNSIEICKSEIILVSRKEKNSILVNSIIGIHNEYYDFMTTENNISFEYSEGYIVINYNNDESLELIKMYNSEGRILRSEMQYIVEVLADFLNIQILKNINKSKDTKQYKSVISRLLDDSE